MPTLGAKQHLRIPVNPSGESVHAFLTTPPDRPSPWPAVILVHGFTSNGAETHGIFLRLMQLLSSKGFLCITFDFRGSGYSDGTFDDMTASRNVIDLSAVVNYARTLVDVDATRIGVVGQSLGGVIAMAALHSNETASAFVLWATPAFFYNNIRRMYGEAWQTSETICLEKGLYLKRAFLEDLRTFDVRDFIAKCAKPKIIMHGDQDAVVAVEDAYAIFDAAAPPKELKIIPGGTHGYKNQKSLENDLLSSTATWLEKQLIT
jgi:alpha-beta hydrolase superfamily lysophospholipase